MLDFSKTFSRYEALVQEVERGVARIHEAHPTEVHCNRRCCDCCFAVFDLSLVEAVYINYGFYSQLEKKEQEEILERAERADRQGYRLKRKLSKEFSRNPEDEERVLIALSRERIQCPLLNESHLCDLYDYRPLTCRVYGVPTAIRGRAHTCGLSGFEEGKSYPTIHLDVVNDRLMELSRDLLAEIGVEGSSLGRRWVPLSTALLTDFNEEYFGL